jgi:hypothetical protein
MGERGRADLGVRASMYDRGVVSVAYSRGLLSFGGGGEEGGKEDADVTNATTAKSFPLPPGLDAIERKLESNVKDSLSSFVLLENYPRCMMQIIVR